MEKVRGAEFADGIHITVTVFCFISPPENSDVFEFIPTSYQLEISQLLSPKWCCTFFSVDVFKIIPKACDFTVPTWDSSRAKVAFGHQKDECSQTKILSAKKKPGSPTCSVQWVCQEMLESSFLAPQSHCTTIHLTALPSAAAFAPSLRGPYP
jgi:hypothetical protein